MKLIAGDDTVIEVIASLCGRPSIKPGVAFPGIFRDILICVFLTEFFLCLSKKVVRLYWCLIA